MLNVLAPFEKGAWNTYLISVSDSQFHSHYELPIFKYRASSLYRIARFCQSILTFTSLKNLLKKHLNFHHGKRLTKSWISTRWTTSILKWQEFIERAKHRLLLNDQICVLKHHKLTSHKQHLPLSSYIISYKYLNSFRCTIIIM